MAERLYEVSVSTAFEMIHVVRATSKREARRVIQDLIFARLEDGDPRIVESYASGALGQEKINSDIRRVPADAEVGTRDA